jgi:hypothetical protein
LGQDQQEDKPQGREQQEELASEVIRSKDGKNGDDVEQRGEKRQHQGEPKEINSGIHHSEDGIYTYNISNEDDEGSRHAKRRRKLKHLATLVGEEQRDTLRDEGRPLSTFIESTFASTASTTPAIFKSAPPIKPQLAVEVIDGNED